VPEVTMTETLFGGLIVAAVLFFTTRKLGLPNFWAGVLSGLLPFIAYIVYSTQHWVGGDVLAIHFAIYLANAGLLMVFGGMQQKKERMHWAPKIIVGFFIGLVILNAVLLTIASRGLPDSFAGIFLPNPDNQKVYTAFPGVIPHDRNKSYEPHLQQVERQREMGWQLNIQGVEHLKQDKPTMIQVAALDADGKPLSGADVDLALWRMANSRDDQHIQLRETQPGLYAAEVTVPDAGRWVIEVVITRGNGIFTKKQSLFVDDE
jgi:nitrogen fixation protein FixH